MKKKWKYADPKLVSEKEKWYENIPDDKELENYIDALLKRHWVGASSGNLAVGFDAALSGLLIKLFYKWSGKKYRLSKDF